MRGKEMRKENNEGRGKRRTGGKGMTKEAKKKKRDEKRSWQEVKGSKKKPMGWSGKIEKEY